MCLLCLLDALLRTGQLDIFGGKFRFRPFYSCQLCIGVLTFGCCDLVLLFRGCEFKGGCVDAVLLRLALLHRGVVLTVELLQLARRRGCLAIKAVSHVFGRLVYGLCGFAAGVLGRFHQRFRELGVNALEHGHDGDLHPA